MKIAYKITALLLLIIASSCKKESEFKNLPLNKDLLLVADSISTLLQAYHYNPKELTSKEYLAIENNVKSLAKSVDTKQEFIDGFNQLWKEGPFSHVRLDHMQRPANQIADFIDSLRVGPQNVTLKFKDTLAILSVNSMLGVDTNEAIFSAYKEIETQKPKALIIDLRNNTGGTFAGLPLVGHILKDSLDAGLFVSRKWWNQNKNAPTFNDNNSRNYEFDWSIKTFWSDVQERDFIRIKFHPLQPKFNGKVYVLISNKTVSAAEFTADAFASLENVTLIGETTAGEMLSQKMYDLPNALQLSLPIADYYSSRMGRIEGKGVAPDIDINQSVALDVAIALSNGENIEEVLASAKETLKAKDKEPLGSTEIYLFGSMNDWGKKWENTPKFKYTSNGIYEVTTALKKGNYELKIAPMNWDFDYGAFENKQNISIDKSMLLIKKPGSDNLILKVNEDTRFKFQLDVSDTEKAKLLVTQ